MPIATETPIYQMYGSDAGQPAHSLYTKGLSPLYDTSVKIIKNEVRCRDDTVPKTVYRYKKALQGRVESMQQSSATPKNKDVGRGLRKIVACSQPYLAVFGTVSSLHLTSFLMIFTLVSLIFSSHRHGKRHPSLNCMRMRICYVKRKLCRSISLGSRPSPFVHICIIYKRMQCTHKRVLHALRYIRMCERGRPGTEATVQLRIYVRTCARARSTSNRKL